MKQTNAAQASATIAINVFFITFFIVFVVYIFTKSCKYSQNLSFNYY